LSPDILAEPILVGRERELEELIGFLDSAIEGKGTTVSVDGFKGDINVKYTPVTSFPPTVINMAVSQLTVHCVLRGFGSFAGQTLVRSYDQPTSVTTA
jgi:hypothetical protein